MREFIGTVMMVGALLAAGLSIGLEVIGRYSYEKRYGYLWELADKSSTIEAKATMIREFTRELQRGRDEGMFARNNALLLRTRNNELASNLQALETLAQRLEEISAMDPKSFQYNTAIQQITAQEQGEAQKLLGVVEGCFMLRSYPLAWGWIAVTIGISSLCALIAGALTRWWEQL